PRRRARAGTPVACRRRLRRRAPGPSPGGWPLPGHDRAVEDITRLGRDELTRVVRVAVVLAWSVLRRWAPAAVGVARRALRARLRGGHRPRDPGAGTRRARAVRLATELSTVASEGLVDGFIALGPTFVKLGQVIASSPGIFPDWLAGPARRCLDEVPPFPAEEVRRTIEEDLGRPLGEVFASFDDVPLSAASIGQVHACVLHDGREAVVKVQRPSIREGMTRDLRVLHAI